MIGNAEEWVADGYDPLRRYRTSQDAIVWPVSDALHQDAEPIRKRLNALREAHVNGWGVAKGGSHSEYRAQAPHAFTVRARTNPHLLSNYVSPLPLVTQDAIDSLSPDFGDATGFRVARPVRIPSRERQLWHWGIYFEHEKWLDLTMDPSDNAPVQ
jgi:hypothetical protein